MLPRISEMVGNCFDRKTILNPLKFIAIKYKQMKRGYYFFVNHTFSIGVELFWLSGIFVYNGCVHFETIYFSSLILSSYTSTVPFIFLLETLQILWKFFFNTNIKVSHRIFEKCQCFRSFS